MSFSILPQTWTSAHPTLITVTSMLSVVTLMDLTLAHVKLDILEMANVAMVCCLCVLLKVLMLCCVSVCSLIIT